MYPFKNLVFEGGGVKGIAYGGALQVLEDKNVLSQITRVAGTSAGAINATLLALNFSVAEVSEIVAGTNFKSFEDIDGTWLSAIIRVIKQYGWFKGDAFRTWLTKYINQKTGSPETTFAELQKMPPEKGFRELYVISSNLTQQRADIFSYKTTPDMPIADAVRMSMSIPLFFSSVKNLNKTTHLNDIMVDGGATWNYAINIFDSTQYTPEDKHTDKINYNTDAGYVFNHETLGFRLASKQSKDYSKLDWSNVPVTIKGFKDYALSLVTFLMETANNLHLHENDWNRTVFIDTLGVNTTDFNLKKEKIDDLIKSGKDGTIAYFNWWDTANDPQRGVIPLADKVKG